MKLSRFAKLMWASALCTGLSLFSASLSSALDIEYTGAETALLDNGRLLPAPSAGGNQVTMSGGELYAATGAFGQGSATSLSGNSLLVTGGKLAATTGELSPLDGLAYGALSYGSGDVCSNRVEILGADAALPGAVGGHAKANVISNTAVLNASGLSLSELVGGRVNGNNTSAPILVCSNEALVRQGEVTHLVIGGHADEYTKATVCHNTVELEGGKVSGEVYGGMTYMGDVLENSILVDAASTVELTDAASLCGGWTEAGNAVGNRVDVLTGTVGKAFGGVSKEGNATGNTLNLADCALSGSEYAAGVAGAGKDALDNRLVLENVSAAPAAPACTMWVGKTDGGTATGNVAELRGAVLLPHVDLVGGAGAAVSGNTLLAVNPEASVKSFTGFDAVTLAFTEWDKDKEYGLEVGDPTSFNGMQVTVDLTQLPEGVTLTEGDVLSIKLPGVDSSQVELQGAARLANPGISTVMEVSLDWLEDGPSAEQALTLTIDDYRANPQVSSLAAGRAAGLRQLKEGADLVADKAVAAAAYGQGQGNSLPALYGSSPIHHHAFFTMSAGHHVADSGSHADVDGMVAVAGVAAALPTTQQPLTLGAFVESGWGKYVSHNSYADAPHVRAGGDVSHYGIGFLGRYEFGQGRARGLAVDASLRLGRQDADYDSRDLAAGATPAHYDLSTTYFAGHIGASYSRAFAHELTLTGYGQLHWARVSDDSARVCGEDVRFGGINSQRLRLGARLTKQLNGRWQPFAGLSWEWEFGGASRLSVGRASGADNSHRGGTATGELGTSFRPDPLRPLWLEGSVQGSVGQWEGFGAKAGVILCF